MALKLPQNLNNQLIDNYSNNLIDQTKTSKADNSSFLKAVRSGDTDAVVHFLDSGKVDVHACNSNGLNALHLASKDGYVDIVNELIKRKCLVDSKSKKGNTALHVASLAGQLEVVMLLIDHGADVNIQSQAGFTPLYMAAQENHADVLRYLLDRGANPAIATEDNYTPMAVAVQQNNNEVVEILTEHEQRGKTKLSPLHLAAKKNDVHATVMLLQSEMDPRMRTRMVNDTTKSGFTPLHIASHYGNLNVAKVLIQHGSNVNAKAKSSIYPLHVSSKWGRTPLVDLLIKNDAIVDCRTKDNLTPLHCSSRSGYDEVADLLIRAGANISARTKHGLTPLHMAVQGDHINTARLLVSAGAPLDENTVDYLTPLHVAAHCGSVGCAKLLLDSQCQANAKALNGFTPLHIACKKNRIRVIELLLQYGADVHCTTETNLTPLHVASFMGYTDIVRYLLSRGSNIEAQTDKGETSLHLATRGNQLDVMRLLLDEGANVDARAKENQTPLHSAARTGSIDAVSLLLYNRALVNAVTKDNYTPLHAACKEGHEEIIQLLLDSGADQSIKTSKSFTPLHIASKYGNTKTADVLISNGGDVNVESKNGLTPLHLATHYNQPDMVSKLLTRKANPHAAARNGYTPLHIAAKYNEVDIAQSLISHKAKPNPESKNGFTPLHLASQEGNVEMVSFLLENKAKVNSQARNGLTSMHLAAQEDYVPVAEVLVKYKADVDPQTKAGYTPLHTACHFGKLNMIEFLLKRGANVSAKTKTGHTPLHQAAQQGHLLVTQMLLKAKANPNDVNEDGQTPLWIAEQLGYISVVELLRNITTVQTQRQVGDKYKIIEPETMHDAAMSDDEEDDDKGELVDQSYMYLTTGDDMRGLGDDSSQQKDGLGGERGSMRVSVGAQDDVRWTQGVDPSKKLSMDGDVVQPMKGAIQSKQHQPQQQPTTSTRQEKVHDNFNATTRIPTLHETHFDDTDHEHKYENFDPKKFKQDIRRQQFGVNGNNIDTSIHSDIYKNGKYPDQYDVENKRLKDNIQGVVKETDYYAGGSGASEAYKDKMLRKKIGQDDGGGYDYDGRKYNATDERLHINKKDGLADETYPDSNQQQQQHRISTGASKPIPLQQQPQQPQQDNKLNEQQHTNAPDLKVDNDMDSSRYKTSRNDGNMRGAGVSPMVSHGIPYFKSNISETDSHVFGSTYSGMSYASSFDPDNVALSRQPIFQGFLVSFMVDARGGAMRGCRHSGIRIIVPPGRASQPTRVTCKLVKKDKVNQLPPLMEGEALASRVLLMGPSGAKFLGPVILEVPHFASLRDNEREIVVWRSDNGMTWKEHTELGTLDVVMKTISGSFDDLESAEDLYHRRITRIISNDFPKYFALVTRIRQDTSTLGPQGGVIVSSIMPQVQAAFPPGALTKSIKLCLQTQRLPNEFVKKMVGSRVSVSPIATVEPRRRKFHRPITITLPLDADLIANNKNIDKSPSLRLLCSMNDGLSATEWEDITGTTPMSLTNNCVSFPIAVSARYWLINTPRYKEAVMIATPMFTEASAVPFIANFVVFAKRRDPLDGQLRIFCMTDDKMDKTLESQEKFIEVARSRDIEVLDERPQWIECHGNLVPVLKSDHADRQPYINFRAFKENRLSLNVRVRDLSQEPAANLLFMVEQREVKDQVPLCNLSVVLPSMEEQHRIDTANDVTELQKRLDELRKLDLNDEDQISKTELRLTDIAEYLEDDWIPLAYQLQISDEDIIKIQSKYGYIPEQALVMLHLWMEKNKDVASGNVLERSLREIGREDIIQKCIFFLQDVTDENEIKEAKNVIYSSSGHPEAVHSDAVNDFHQQEHDEHNAQIDSDEGPKNIIEERIQNIPDKVQIVNEKIHVVPEKIQIISEKPQNIPEKVQIAPEKVQIVPGKVQIVPDKVHVVPDKVQIVPDKVQIVPDKVQMVPEIVQIDPEKVQIMSDKIVQIVPEKIHIIPDKVQIVSEIIQITPKDIFISPEIVRSKLDKMQTTPTDIQTSNITKQIPTATEGIKPPIDKTQVTTESVQNTLNGLQNFSDDIEITPDVEIVEKVDIEMEDRTSFPKSKETKSAPKAFEDWVECQEMTYHTNGNGFKDANFKSSIDRQNSDEINESELSRHMRKTPSSEELLREGEKEIEVRVEMEDDDQVLDDGTMIKRQVITRSHIAIPDQNFDNSQATCLSERLVKVEVDEDVLELPPGVADPGDVDPDSVDSRTYTSRETGYFSDFTHGERIPFYRKITKTVINFIGKQNVPSSHDSPVKIPRFLSNTEAHLVLDSTSNELSSEAGLIVDRAVKLALEQIQSENKHLEDYEGELDLSNIDSSVAVRVYTDTVEKEPEIETDVKEFEETLEDGTVLRRRVIKKKEKQTIIKRVVMEGPEDELPADELQAQEFLKQVDYDDESSIPWNTYDSREHDNNTKDTKTECEEYEDVQEDGTLVKRKVVTTVERQLTTERVVLEGDISLDEEDESPTSESNSPGGRANETKI